MKKKPVKKTAKKERPKSLSDKLKKSGIVKIVIKSCPLPLRPELLLHPNLPKPMHGRNPRTIYGTNWWNRKRRAVYKAANHCCQACGVHKSQAKSRKWVEAHEVYDIDYKKGTAKFTEVVSLCNYCHNFIHSGRLQALLDQGLLHHSKYVAIIQYGDEVLRKAGLSKKSHAEREADMKMLVNSGEVAAWEDWRLIIGKRRYKPFYKTYRHWWTAMNGGAVEDEG